jgi:hypothetical protein
MTSNLFWRIQIQVDRVPKINILAINRKKHIASDMALPLQGQSLMVYK